jgi:VanZ family protein
LRYNGHYTYQAVENVAYQVPVWVARFSGIIIYFLMSLLMMFSGVRARRMSWINIGSLMVVFTAIALVTDVLRSYTFSGLVLVGAGLLLLALGVLLEKSRRRLIRTVCNPQPSTSQS